MFGVRRLTDMQAEEHIGPLQSRLSDRGLIGHCQGLDYEHSDDISEWHSHRSRRRHCGTSEKKKQHDWACVHTNAGPTGELLPDTTTWQQRAASTPELVLHGQQGSPPQETPRLGVDLCEERQRLQMQHDKREDPTKTIANGTDSQ